MWRLSSLSPNLSKACFSVIQKSSFSKASEALTVWLVWMNLFPSFFRNQRHAAMPLSFLDSWLWSPFSKGLCLRKVLCFPQTSFFSSVERVFWSCSACSSGSSAASAACWTFSWRESFPIFSKFLLQTFPSLLLALALAFPSLPCFSKLLPFPFFTCFFITFLGGIASVWLL